MVDTGLTLVPFDCLANLPIVGQLSLRSKAIHSHINLEYNPTQPEERQKAVYGTPTTTRKARDRWLLHAADVIYSTSHLEVKQALCNHARRYDLHGELARAILIHNISTATDLGRRELAQKLVLFFLHLAHDHSCDDAQTFLQSDERELLGNLQDALRATVQAKRTERDEAQITALFGALLEFPSVGVNLRQYELAKDYTASQNAYLCASVFGITRTKEFGDFNSEEMCSTLSESLVFSGETISVQNLEEWTLKTMKSLRVGFPKGYLDLSSQLLSRFPISQVDDFASYCAHIHQVFPPLRKPSNSDLLLLVWSTKVYGGQFEVVSEWARMRDSWSLHEQLARDFQEPQSVEQLALTLIAFMSDRRLNPDSLDYYDQPIKGCYLADLNALLCGHALGNSGVVSEKMIFSLIRVLHSFKNQFEDLIEFLKIALDRPDSVLHAFDGFPDQYWSRRIKRKIKGQSYETAMQSHETAMAELSDLKMPEVREDDHPDWVTVRHLELSLQNCSRQPYSETSLPAMWREGFVDMVPSWVAAVSSPGDEYHLAPSSGSYKLVRVSGIPDENLLEIFAEVRKEVDVLHIEELSDGAWELVVLESHCCVLQDKLDGSCSNVDLNCNPFEPTPQDVAIWGYDRAKKLCEVRFPQRAKGIIGGRLPAAAFYDQLLADQPLVPTCEGYVESEKHAAWIVKDCVRGK